MSEFCWTVFRGQILFGVYFEIDWHYNFLPVFINSKSLLYLLEVFDELKLKFISMPILTTLSVETHLNTHSCKLWFEEIDVQLIVIFHNFGDFLDDTIFKRHLIIIK